MKHKNILFGLVIITGILIFGHYSFLCLGNDCTASIGYAQKIEDFSNPEIFQRQLNNGEMILVDVREDDEWNLGHVAGATHIALGKLSLETTKELSKDKPIYLYCRSGKRAGSAEIIMRELGFFNVKNIGGVIDWQKNGGLLVQ